MQELFGPGPVTVVPVIPFGPSGRAGPSTQGQDQNYSHISTIQRRE